MIECNHPELIDESLRAVMGHTATVVKQREVNVMNYHEVVCLWSVPRHAGVTVARERLENGGGMGMTVVRDRVRLW